MLFIHALLLGVLERCDVSLIILQSFNRFAQLIILFLERFDLVVHVCLRLVSNQSLLQAVRN